MSILRDSVYFFGALALFAIAAFWPTYLARIRAVEELHVHAHGIVMALWLLMLITQAFLIRTDRRRGGGRSPSGTGGCRCHELAAETTLQGVPL